MNRCNERPIRIEAAAVVLKPLTGVFDADDPELLLQFLGREPDLRDKSVTIRGNAQVIAD